MSPVNKLILAGLNHMLQRESWARERLRQHAGGQVAIEAGPFHLDLLIDQRGLLANGEPSRLPTVTVTLPGDTPARILLDRDNLFSSVRISGSVDLAESLAFVFRHLRWDVEGDLATIIGDIPARRLALFGRQLGERLIDGSRRLAQNAAEYATEDSSLLAARRDVEAFAKEIDRVRDELTRLEARIDRI